MSGFDQTFADSILDASMGGTAISVTTPITVRLMTANGSDTANGTELTTGGGYTAGSGPSVTFAAAGSGSKASNAVVSVTNMPAATITGVELWDSTATPKRIMWGALTANVTTNAGDTFSIASGSLTASLA